MVSETLSKWTRGNRFWLGLVFEFIMGSAIVTDLIMVLVLKVTSISMATWIATQAHPTLIAAGVLATVGVCYLVRESWGLVMFAGLMGGHLFIHW
jgi:hypothetical protein